MESKPPNPPPQKPVGQLPPRAEQDAEPKKHSGAQPRSNMSEFEIKMREIKRKREGAAASARHALVEWTMVRCLAYSERLIVFIAAGLFWMDKDREFLTFSGAGFVFFSLVILAPIYGILMFVSALGVYWMLKKNNVNLKSSKEYKKVIYILTAVWIPMIYGLSYYGMELYYDLIKSFPAWDKIKEMVNWK